MSLPVHVCVYMCVSSYLCVCLCVYVHVYVYVKVEERLFVLSSLLEHIVYVYTVSVHMYVCMTLCLIMQLSMWVCNSKFGVTPMNSYHIKKTIHNPLPNRPSRVVVFIQWTCHGLKHYKCCIAHHRVFFIRLCDRHVIS